jgi:spermidine synthase
MVEQRDREFPTSAEATWVDEILNGVRYGLAATVLEDRHSDFQRVTIIDSQAYGRALLLDGCWMTAERQ